MSDKHYPMVYGASRNAPRMVPQASLAMGGLGAIIGGTAAAAKNIRQVKNDEVNREEAVKDTLKETAGAGIATAAATAVVGAVGATGLIGVLGILTVATGTKYLYDSAMTPEAGEKETPKKPSASKSAKTKKSG